MLNIEKDLNCLIDDAIEESKLYLDMYNNKLKDYKEKLKTLEENKDKFIDNYSVFKYEEERNEYLNAIEKYKAEIKHEKDSINRLLINKKNN